jgi:hypothetical protein
MTEQTPNTPRSRAAFVFHGVLCLWLIGLSAVALVGWKATPRLAQQDQLDAVQRQQQTLDERLTALDENIRALRAQPQAATASALQSTRETLETRFVPIEQTLSTQIGDLTELRTEIERLKTRQAAMQAPAAVRPRETRPAVVVPKEQPIPFRVIGVELRAGQRSVSVAPVPESSQQPLADQIQPVLVGETIGAWRLEAIDGQAAVFRSGEQIRRLTIPSRDARP